MKIGIYLGHPAQYHFFKYTIKALQERNHHVLILLKTKDVLEPLVKQSGLSYINIQKKSRKTTLFSITFAYFQRTWRIFCIAKKEKLELLIGTDAAVAQAAKLLSKPALTTLEDDVEIVSRLAKLTYPFTTHIITPMECNVGKWVGKKIGYEGYMKLAYLHPNQFTPNVEVLRSYIKEQKYCLIRLAQLTAFHDVGVTGLNVNLVLSIIKTLKELGYKAYISSESQLDESLVPYQLKIRVADIHDVMSGASVVISDSQSMSVEAAMLGIPSLRFSDFAGKIRILETLEHKYKLTFGIKTNNPQLLFSKLIELLSNPTLKEDFLSRRQEMLRNKIDVTAFMVWFIENYPQSAIVMKNNPNFQFQFK